MSSRPLLVLIALTIVALACGSTDSVDTADDDGATTADDAGETSDGPDGRWTLVAVTIDGAPLELPDTARPIDLEIDGDTIGGSGGCNSWGGGIDAGGDGSLALTDLAITEMACLDPGVMGFESSYVAVLVGLTGWSIDGGTLVLTSDAAEIRYAAAAPPVDQPLVGTVWRFDTIFTGSGDAGAASSTDQSGPTVTMVVSEDMAVLDSAGCDAPIEISLNHEGDDRAQIVDGNLNADDSDDDPTAACPDPTNLVDAVDGLLRSTGFTIAERRLTLSGPDGPTVGFIADDA